mmetsp:Transcript_25062/g.54647  ORF Transcript_25062/g.54647 Transcript_25062/m.54647 type:complete len:232 (-) Transcript_25062:172-867(-)|eukprot:CAMPEP_0178511808 /NCGR_PEP_ID=MMETSP0696-20121128/22559_1 /TAXON_ID=265572 /ORGANISM="Extubocellulus spinifer, Strain CCMP396" /LENGTH=231 /DNA_ID=CAMNT_0020141605 /DNA_START=58 /DNA_END=753 /DNA_ORIENTATION=+
MKLSISVSVSVSALAVALSATGVASKEELQRALVQKISTAQFLLAAHNRRTQFSDTCKAEMDALAENEQYNQAATDLVMNCMEAMSITDSPPAISMDFTKCADYLATVDSVCEEIGGKVTDPADFSLACNLDGQSVSISMKGTPTCYGASCDLNKLNAELQGLENNPELASLMDELNAECTVNLDGTNVNVDGVAGGGSGDTVFADTTSGAGVKNTIVAGTGALLVASLLS